MPALTKPSQRAARPEAIGLRVSAYDRASSLLIALLVVVGFFVALLFGVWLTTQMLFSKASPPVEVVESSVPGDDAEGSGADLEEPGMEEIERIAEPQVQSSLSAVIAVVSANTDMLDSSITGRLPVGGGDSENGRLPGPVSPQNDDVIPEWQRWEIRFATSGIEAYARQLDFFGIELAAVGGGMSKVIYASNLTRDPKPNRRESDPASEKRLYMSWQGDSPLKIFDRELLAKAGISSAGRLVLQFYPADTVQLLLKVEAEAAKKRGHTDPREFQRTIFVVQPTRDAFEFQVTEQYFRPVPAL